MTDRKAATSLLLLALLLLRIPLVVGINWAFNLPPSWIIDLFDVSVYVLIGALIWVNKNSLNDFNISRISLWIYIVSGTFLTLNTSVTTFLFWIAGLFVFWLLIRGQLVTKSTTEDYLWAVRGLFLGFGLSFIISMLSPTTPVPGISKPSFLFGAGAFLHELSRAALPEEMIFRGFLWGYMKNIGFEEKRTLILQAVLFWLAHLNYFEKNYTFWIVVPLMGISLGLLAWRSRSVTSSILLHAMYNTMRFFL